MFRQLLLANGIDAGAGVNKAFTFFPYGKQAVIGRPDGSVAIIDSESGNPVRRFDLTGNAQAVAIGMQGRLLAVGMENGVEDLDAETGAQVAALDCAARTLAWSPDGRLFVSQGLDGTIRLWVNAGLALPCAVR